MIVLRPYQETILQETRAALLAGHRSVVIVAPTGAGKTALAARMLYGAFQKNKRAWFICHRQELLRQSVATIQDSTGITAGIVAAGFGSVPFAPIQVCTIQTLVKRFERLPRPDVIVWDEVHHLPSKSWANLKAQLNSATHIGITATAQRLDGRGLGDYFSKLILGPSTATLIEQGYLAKYRLFAPTVTDLSSVHTVAGDYNKQELDEALRGSKVVGDAVAEYRRHCMGKRALFFLWSVRASEQMAETLNAIGIPAAHVDGKTKEYDRLQAMRDFARGKILALCNCELYGEGIDVVACEAGFFLRPTQSTSLCLQQWGRLLRPCPGVARKLLFDHAGNSFRHGLPDQEREWSLEGLVTRDKKKQEVPIRQCMRCFAVLSAAAKVCPECGFVFEVKPREVELEDGELKELGAEDMERLYQAKQARIEQGRANTREQLLAIARKRGYNPSWVDHIIAARERKQHKTMQQVP